MILNCLLINSPLFLFNRLWSQSTFILLLTGCQSINQSKVLFSSTFTCNITNNFLFDKKKSIFSQHFFANTTIFRQTAYYLNLLRSICYLIHNLERDIIGVAYS